MAFASPLWLLALVPWALLAAWLLRGRRRRVKVPFLGLWRGPLPLEISRRGWRIPPLWLSLALASLLATILAAGKPMFRTGHAGGTPLTIIVDRGISMSARELGTRRFVAVCERVDQQLRQTILPDQIRLVTVPGETTQTSGGHWVDAIRNLPPTALDTDDARRATALDELARSDRPVLLISDQTLAISNPRLVQIAPNRAVENAGIVKLAARATPTPQVMVRVRNDLQVPPVPSPAEVRSGRTAGGGTGGTTKKNRLATSRFVS